MKEKLLLGLIVFLAFILRFYQLGEVPLSLYWDEASLGYNAYSIATTLRDEHGEFLPFARFIAFGDYKPPAYIYADALVVKPLGLSEFSTRLPSAFAGTLLVLVTFFLAKEMLGNRTTALLSSFFVAVSPWSLQVSRAAFEANLATFFSATGVLLFLRALRLKSSIFYFLSSIFFALAMYTFNSHRVFVPLMLVALTTIFLRQILSQWKHLLFFIFFLFLLLFPLFPHLLSREGSLRFQEVSWLNDPAPIELSNKRIAQDGNDSISKVLHNRRLIFLGEFLKHYSDNFKASFLLFSGDPNPKLSIQTVGELFWLDFPFLLAGIFFLFKFRSKTSAILLTWFFLAPVPAAFARETPHALRILNMLPVPQIIIAAGVLYLVQILNRRNILPFCFLLSVFYSLSVLAYLHDYYFHYPNNFALDWQYGYKQAVTYVSSVEQNYDRIIITNKYGRPYIFFLYYKKYPPPDYWKQKKVDRDWFGFWTVHSFGKFIFDGSVPKGKNLYVFEPEVTPETAKIQKTIISPNGQTVFNIYEN